MCMGMSGGRGAGGGGARRRGNTAACSKEGRIAVVIKIHAGSHVNGASRRVLPGLLDEAGHIHWNSLQHVWPVPISATTSPDPDCGGAPPHACKLLLALLLLLLLLPL